MPTRVEYFVTDEGIEYEIPILPETAEKATLIPQVGLTLRKLDVDKTRYDPTGKYYETIVVLPNWRAEGLDALFGFEACEQVEPDVSVAPLPKAKIGYQLSNDDGVTWRVWVDGPDAWLPAVGIYLGVFNDKDMVDRRINLFPMSAGPHQIRVRVKLTPGSAGRQRPILRLYLIYSDLHMDIFEDVSRSLKRYVESKVRVPMYYTADLVAPAASFTIPVETGMDVTISTPVRAYNITLDPGRTTNIFFSLVGRTVTFTGLQLGVVEIQFTGIPEVFITAEEFFQVSKIPSIVVFVTRLNYYPVARQDLPEVERSVARMVGRLEVAREFYMIYASVRAQSSLKREALQMTDALIRILEKGDCFLSVASGECYCIMDQESAVAEDRVAQGLYVGSVNLKILGKVWTKGTIENEANLFVEDHVIPLVKDVKIAVGAEVSCNLNLPPHLRGHYREGVDIASE